MLYAPDCSEAAPVGYSLTITTAYAAGDPFATRINSAFTEPSTGFFQIQNTGDTIFSGVVGTIAVSAFAGDLSFTSGTIVLVPDASVSIAISDNADVVGGFNGPAYQFRTGVQITLSGTVSNGGAAEAVTLLVADADIHSGVTRTDEFGLSSDSFVLQGGDPWGFQTADAFALSQAAGVFTFAETVPEPGSAAVLAVGLAVTALARRRFLVRSRAG